MSQRGRRRPQPLKKCFKAKEKNLKFYAECEPCLLKAARWIVDSSTDDNRLRTMLRKRFEKEVPTLLRKNIYLGVPRHVRDIVRKTTGVQDPFKAYKRRYNKTALRLVPILKKWIEKSNDRLLVACRLAIAGNVIDFVANSDFNLIRTVRECAGGEFGIFDYPEFKKKLQVSTSILYVGDNAGEIVFDKLLIEELLKDNKKVTYVVRGGPVLNDATMEDARAVGLTQLTEVITTGAALPGALLSESSPKFVERFKKADLVISKGQGNFEALSDEPGPIYFLLKAKCVPVSRELGVKQGAMIIKKQRLSKRRKDDGLKVCMLRRPSKFDEKIYKGRLHEVRKI